MLFLLADDNLPDGMSDVLVFPIGLTLLGCFIYYAGWWVERRSAKSPWKWIGVVPLAYGMWFGWTNFLNRWLENPVYRFAVAQGREKKMMAAHWGSFLIPLFGLTAIVLFHCFNHKLGLEIDDD